MSGLTDIESAVRELTDQELKQLRDILDELEEERWDRQIEQDALAGKFDKLASEAREDFKNGRCRKL